MEIKKHITKVKAFKYAPIAWFLICMICCATDHILFFMGSGLCIFILFIIFFLFEECKATYKKLENEYSVKLSVEELMKQYNQSENYNRTYINSDVRKKINLWMAKFIITNTFIYSFMFIIGLVGFGIIMFTLDMFFKYIDLFLSMIVPYVCIGVAILFGCISVIVPLKQLGAKLIFIGFSVGFVYAGYLTLH